MREAGGGLVVMGGDRSMSLGGYEVTALADVAASGPFGRRAGAMFRPGRYRVRPTQAGEAHPILRWSPEPARNQRVWETLPPMDGLNWSLKARPGAVVVAETPEVRNEYGPAPVIALGEYGAGRTMVLMTDSLWRWKMPYAAAGGEETLYQDFWTRSLRWLVHEPDMELVRLAVPPGSSSAGAPLRFSARVLDRRYLPARGARLKGALLSEAGRATELTWKETAPGEYLSDPVTPDKPGLWKVWTEAVHDAALLGRDEIGFPVGLPSPEPLRLGIDRAYLEALAASSGGKVFDAADGALFELLTERGRAEREVVGRTVDEPWASAAFLLVALVLLGLDWGLRRLYE